MVAPLIQFSEAFHTPTSQLQVAPIALPAAFHAVAKPPTVARQTPPPMLATQPTPALMALTIHDHAADTAPATPFHTAPKALTTAPHAPLTSPDTQLTPAENAFLMPSQCLTIATTARPAGPPRAPTIHGQFALMNPRIALITPMKALRMLSQCLMIATTARPTGPPSAPRIHGQLLVTKLPMALIAVVNAPRMAFQAALKNLATTSQFRHSAIPAATSAATAMMSRPIGFAASAAFHTHWTAVAAMTIPRHTIITPLAMVVAAVHAVCASAIALCASSSPVNTATSGPSISLYWMKNRIAVDTTGRIVVFIRTKNWVRAGISSCPMRTFNPSSDRFHSRCAIAALMSDPLALSLRVMPICWALACRSWMPAEPRLRNGSICRPLRPNSWTASADFCAPSGMVINSSATSLMMSPMGRTFPPASRVSIPSFRSAAPFPSTCLENVRRPIWNWPTSMPSSFNAPRHCDATDTDVPMTRDSVNDSVATPLNALMASLPNFTMPAIATPPTIVETIPDMPDSCWRMLATMREPNDCPACWPCCPNCFDADDPACVTDWVTCRDTCWLNPRTNWGTISI